MSKLEGVEDALWALQSYESNRDDGVRSYSEIEITSMVEAVRAVMASAKHGSIDMLLWCPKCKTQHVDAPQPEQGWTNPPHATHTCQGCGLNWRPSNALTNGVQSLPAKEPNHLERMAAADPNGYATATAIGYLCARHAAISARIDQYTSPGHGAPGFVEQLQRDLRGIEEAMSRTLGAKP